MPVKEIRNLWETMWIKREDENTGADLDKYLVEHLSGEEPLNVFKEVGKYLPNWKTAGHHGVYNLFIKKLESLHLHLYEVVRRVCLENQSESDWFYKGITYLIPKERFRPQAYSLYV